MKTSGPQFLFMTFTSLELFSYFSRPETLAHFMDPHDQLQMINCNVCTSQISMKLQELSFPWPCKDLEKACSFMTLLSLHGVK